MWSFFWFHYFNGRGKAVWITQLVCVIFGKIKKFAAEDGEEVFNLTIARMWGIKKVRV